jgi:hypothetical protein
MFLAFTDAQRHNAVKSLKLEAGLGWKNDLVWGNIFRVVSREVVGEWLVDLPGLERVEVVVTYSDPTYISRVGISRGGLIVGLGVRLKGWVDEGRPGIKCVIKAVGVTYTEG